MKKEIIILLILLFGNYMFSQSNIKSRVAFYGFMNYSDDSSYEAPCNTATDNITLSLKLLNSFTLILPERIPRDFSNKTLSKWCLSENVDYIVYGIMSVKNEESFESKLIIYNSKTDSKIEKRSDFSSILDLFTITDQQTRDICDEITQHKILYGSLSISNKPDLYEIIIDGNNIGSKIIVIDSITVGTHNFKLVNQEKVGIFSENIFIEEGKSTNIDCLAFLSKNDETKKKQVEPKTSNSRTFVDNIFKKENILALGYGTSFDSDSYISLRYIDKLNSFFYIPIEISYYNRSYAYNKSYTLGTAVYSSIVNIYSIDAGFGVFHRFFNRIEPFLDVNIGFCSGGWKYSETYLNNTTTDDKDWTGWYFSGRTGIYINLTDHIMLCPGFVVEVFNTSGGCGNFYLCAAYSL
jgi:hypothetical protein